MSYRHPIQPQLRPQVVALTSTHAESSAFASTTKSARVCSDVDAWILFGSAPVATNQKVYLPAKTPQVFSVEGGWKVSGITTSTGNLYVTESDAVI